MSILINNLVNGIFDSAVVANAFGYTITDGWVPVDEMIESNRTMFINSDKLVWPTDLDRLVTCGVTPINIFLRSPFTEVEIDHRYGVWYVYPEHISDPEYMTKLLVSVIEQIDIQALEDLGGKNTAGHYYSS